jgi:UDP-galactopyranose mutase
MFERMLEACGDNVALLLNTDYREAMSSIRFRHMIYTGPIDAFYDHRFGHLPYRSLRFEHESFDPAALKPRETISGKPGFWQPAMQVNYPNEEAFTRIVEIKHATGQLCKNTTIVREYPDDFAPGKEPFYPIPTPQTAALYHQYKALAETEPNTSFIGRLATYRYYNMDQVVGMALAEFDRVRNAFSERKTFKQTS